MLMNPFLLLSIFPEIGTMVSKFDENPITNPYIYVKKFINLTNKHLEDKSEGGTHSDISAPWRIVEGENPST